MAYIVKGLDGRVTVTVDMQPGMCVHEDNELYEDVLKRILGPGETDHYLWADWGEGFLVGRTSYNCTVVCKATKLASLLYGSRST